MTRRRVVNDGTPHPTRHHMNFTTRLTRAEALNDSMLCVGLDPDPAKFPGSWKDDPSRIFDFCATIVDATQDLVIAF